MASGSRGCLFIRRGSWFSIMVCRPPVSCFHVSCSYTMLDMIAMFRSAEDRHRVSTTDEKPPSPIPSYRKRSGAFSMVVDMIESVFTASRKRCLAFLHQEVKQVCFLAFRGNYSIDAPTRCPSLVSRPYHTPSSRRHMTNL